MLGLGWITLLACDIALRVASFRRLQETIGKRQAKRSKEQPDDPSLLIHRTRDMLDVARRHHLYPMTCLRHALALQWLLKRQGIDSDLRVGISKKDGQLSAHAWLERNGLVISEPELISEEYFMMQPISNLQSD